MSPSRPTRPMSGGCASVQFDPRGQRLGIHPVIVTLGTETRRSYPSTPDERSGRVRSRGRGPDARSSPRRAAMAVDPARVRHRGHAMGGRIWSGYGALHYLFGSVPRQWLDLGANHLVRHPHCRQHRLHGCACHRRDSSLPGSALGHQGRRRDPEGRLVASTLRPPTIEAANNGFAIGTRRVFHPAGTFDERYESATWARDLGNGVRVTPLADPSSPRVHFDLGPAGRQAEVGGDEA